VGERLGGWGLVFGRCMYEDGERGRRGEVRGERKGGRAKDVPFSRHVPAPLNSLEHVRER